MQEGLIGAVIAIGSAIALYLKGKSDAKCEIEQEKAKILSEHNKIDAKDVKREEVYDHTRW